jgi:hypothetical protein
MGRKCSTYVSEKCIHASSRKYTTNPQSATYFSATAMSLSSSSPSLLALEMLWADAMLTLSLVEAELSFRLGDDRSSVLLLDPDLPIKLNNQSNLIT